MSPTNNHLGLLATLTLLFLDVIGASDSTTAAPVNVYVPCEGGSNRLLQLEELVHISDVVMNGVVLSNTITQDEFGTFRASISYYYAYKTDPLLYRRGLASVDVMDFPERPSGEDYSFFFLVRQPNAELSLYCKATLSELDSSLRTKYYNLSEIIKKVKEVATADVERNRHFVPPYPDPCDSNHTNTSCSSVGSHCTVKNTLTNETSRCTCISGFHGDGFTCSPRTVGAAEMECFQCTHGARCVSGPPSEEQQRNSVLLADSEDREGDLEVQPTINCNCQHYKCTGLASRPLCATNGVTYSNECYMRREACQRQMNIYKLHDGHCRQNSIQPCLGLGTPLSTLAGLVTCSATGECPTMHFCHNTVGVCCPVTAPTSATTQRWATVATPTPATPSSGSGEGTDIESSGNGATDDGGGPTDIGGGAVDLGSGDNSVD